MNIFKNGVGRPSNETIKKRNIIKIGGFLLVALACVVLSYSLSKMGTKRLSGAVIKSEDKISLVSKIPLEINFDKYEPYELYEIGNKIYCLLREDVDNTRKYYLALIDDNGIVDEDDWIELYKPNDSSLDSKFMKSTKDGGFIYSTYGNSNYVIKMNLDGTYWKQEIPCEPIMFVDDNYIYVDCSWSSDHNHGVELLKFDYDGNKKESIIYDLSLDNEEVKDTSLMNFKSYKNNIYFIVEVDYYSSSSYDDELVLVKTDAEGNELNKIHLKVEDLDINSDEFDEIYFDRLGEDDINGLAVFEERIELFVMIDTKVYSGDSSNSYSSGSNSYKNFLKKVIISQNSFDIKEIINYDDERLSFDEFDNSYVFPFNININDNEDIFYIGKVIWGEESYSSGSDSENSELELEIIKVDKKGNVIKDNSISVGELVNSERYEAFYMFLDKNKMYLPYIDYDEEQMYLASINYSSENGINVEESDGGKLVVKTQGQTFSEGQDIELVVTPNDGNKLKELKFFDKDGNDVTSSITVTNNTFKMPAYGVVVKAIFEKDGNNNDDTTTSNGGGNNNETTYTTLNKFNPSTYDNIMKFIIIGVVALIVVAGSVILVIKNKKK